MSARRRQRAEEAEATPLAPEADDTLPAAAPPETSDAQRLSPAAAEHLFPERRPPTAFERLFAAVNGAVRPQPPKARHEIASSTLLQQLVCANSVLSALWAAGWICLFLWKASVWEPPLHVVILSPTLLQLAIQVVVTVIRDARIREEAHVIRAEVGHLMEDVDRMFERVMKLQQHFGQAQRDVEQIVISAEKVAKRGARIESLEIETDDPERAASPAPRAAAGDA